MIRKTWLLLVGILLCTSIQQGQANSYEEQIQLAIQTTMMEASRAIEQHGESEAAFKQIQSAPRRLAETPGLLEQPRMDKLHGSKKTKAVVLASKGVEDVTLILARFAEGEPTPVHNHETWGVAYVVKGRDHYTKWERVDAEAESDRAELRVVYEKQLVPGDSEYWFGPPRDIHSQEAKGGPAWELVCSGKNMLNIHRHYFDPETGEVKKLPPLRD